MPARRPLPILVIALAALLGCGRGEQGKESLASRLRVPGQPDVAFHTTPDPVVLKMLELAEVRADDVVYDLGCGDGRIPIAAAKKYGAKAVGIEIDPAVVAQARDNVKANDIGHLVTIREGDIFAEDFGDATVVLLYLLPNLNEELLPKLRKLKTGARVVSHSFPMKGAKPERVEQFLGKKLLLWRVPIQPE